jgi:hypothetical protein
VLSCDATVSRNLLKRNGEKMRKTRFVTASTPLLFIPIWRCFSSYNASHIQYPPVNHTVGTSASRCVGSESNTQYRSPTAFCYCLLSWIVNPCLGPVSRKRCPRYEYDDSTHPCQNQHESGQIVTPSRQVSEHQGAICIDALLTGFT